MTRQNASNGNKKNNNRRNNRKMQHQSNQQNQSSQQTVGDKVEISGEVILLNNISKTSSEEVNGTHPVVVEKEEKSNLCLEGNVTLVVGKYSKEDSDKDAVNHTKLKTEYETLSNKAEATQGVLRTAAKRMNLMNWIYNFCNAWASVLVATVSANTIFTQTTHDELIAITLIYSLIIFGASIALASGTFAMTGRELHESYVEVSKIISELEQGLKFGKKFMSIEQYDELNERYLVVIHHRNDVVVKSIDYNKSECKKRQTISRKKDFKKIDNKEKVEAIDFPSFAKYVDSLDKTSDYVAAMAVFEAFTSGLKTHNDKIAAISICDRYINKLTKGRSRRAQADLERYEMFKEQLIAHVGPIVENADVSTKFSRFLKKKRKATNRRNIWTTCCWIWRLVTAYIHYYLWNLATPYVLSLIALTIYIFRIIVHRG